MERLAKTAFLVSLVSYVIFLGLDYAKPGFVSDHMSAHLWLAACLVSGAWWAWYEPVRARPLFGAIVVAMLGLIGAAVVWDIGRPFGDFRVLIVVVVVFLPSMVWAALAQAQES